MLPAKNRLRKSFEITRVYKRGRYGGGGVLSLKAYRTGQSESRAVVIVAKKISKRAVVRNRIRRRLIESLRADWGTVARGYDIVVSVHQDISQASPAELTQALHQTLERANLISPKSE